MPAPEMGVTRWAEPGGFKPSIRRFPVAGTTVALLAHAGGPLAFGANAMGNELSVCAAQDTPRYRVCETCGQEFDTTDVEQVFHHDGEPHRQLPPFDAALTSNDT